MGTPVGISPMRASGFLSTLGVVTHIPYTDGGYVNLGNVVADLHYLGITQVRDFLSDGSNGGAPLSSDIYLAQQGIKFTTIVEVSTTAGLNYYLSLIDQVNAAVPGSITAVEGPNEINNFPLTFNGVSGLQGAIDLQKALYADVHSDPHLAGVPVDYFTGYAAGSIGTGPNPYTTAGLADYDTQHPYPTYGQAPAWFVNPSNALPNEGPVYGPAVYTETGYSTNGGSSGGLVAVNQDVQAKYTLDLLMDAAKDGISKTYLYQLMDAYQPGSPQGDDGFGLFDPNNAPKEAATAIHNLTTILADNGVGSNTFATTPLNYSVTGLPSTGNNMLMEKSNGAYDIVVWNEPQIWNQSTGTEITAPTVNVTVQLGTTYSEVEVFDPLTGSTPIQTHTQVSSVQLGITDHPLIVEIEPVPTSTTVIQTDTNSFGSTSLATIGNNYFLYAAGSTTGPELRYNGSPVTSNWGGWSPIGAVKTANGYDVAWKVAGADGYTAWSTDNNGNYLSNIVGVLSGASWSLESLETVFNQDLNGDGVIGLNPHVIQTDTSSFGSTSLATIGNNYFLYAAGSTTGPELQYNGSPVTSNWGGWSPIGAVKTANGYDVAWKVAGADGYTAWSTDNNGNYLSNIVGVLSGASWSLESLETVFNQDLNGDGVIGLNPHVIQTDTSSFGSTSLATIGNNYFLYAAGSTTGPELRYNGSPVTSNWGGWSPIGAVETANGYDVAWKVAGADGYTAWSTDNNGNYLSNIVGVLSGASWSLESLETVFNQDLNGDGVIGLNPHVIQTDTSSFGSTSLATIGNNYFLYAAGSTTGPELQYNGSPVTSNWGGWSPIGAVKTANGYDVAWKVAGADGYTAWSTDNNGNYLSNIVGVLSGASWSLESLETVFNQDLNGDGVIGLNPHVIQTDTSSFGSTSLATIGNNYFLYAAGSTTGPELRYNGSPVTSNWGGWSPIAAVKTANGYDVAWKVAGADGYTAWSTDNNGNYLSNIAGVLSGASWSLESLETVFNQDLNADGVVGLYVAPSGTLKVTQALAGSSGAATIGAGAVLELTAADSATVVFATSIGILKLDQPSTFSAQIFGFTGDGALSGSDQIDVEGINFRTVRDSYANGVLSVSDGTHSATLNFHGTYTLANFKFADDGNGGTIVYDPPVPGLPPTAHVSVDPRNDVFVFHPLGLSVSGPPPEPAPNFNQHVEFAAAPSTMQYAPENITSDVAHDAIALHHAALSQLQHAHLLV